MTNKVFDVMTRYLLCFVVLICCSRNLHAQRASPNQWQSETSSLLLSGSLNNTPLGSARAFANSDDPVYNGVLIGAAIGGVSGFFLLEVLSQGDAYPSRSIPFGIVVGALIGLVVDASR